MYVYYRVRGRTRRSEQQRNENGTYIRYNTRKRPRDKYGSNGRDGWCDHTYVFRGWLLTELFELVEVPVTLTGHLDTVITKSVKEIRSICSVQGKHHCLLVPAWKRARMRQKQRMMKFNYEILHITTDRLSISVMLIISIFFFSVWAPNSMLCQLVFFIVPPSTVRLVIIVGCYLYTMYCSFTYVPLCSCWRCPVLTLYLWLLRWWCDGVLVVLFYVCLTFICILSCRGPFCSMLRSIFFSVSGVILVLFSITLIKTPIQWNKKDRCANHLEKSLEERCR